MDTTHRSLPATLIAALMALGTGAVGAAGADALAGRYGLTATGTCLSSPNGFLPNRVAIEPSSASSVVNQGVLVFHRDGSGSASITQTSLNLPPAAASYAGSARISFDFTHQLGPDGSMRLDMRLASFAATYLTGPLAGLSATFVTDPPWPSAWVWSGTHSEDRKTLLLNNGDTVSRYRFSNGAEASLVCQYQRVLTRLTP